MADEVVALPGDDAAVGTAGRITWIGTATVLIEVAGFRILTDPNFLHQGDHAKLGGGLRSRRLTEPASDLPSLLPVDIVVLSHHHGDHFDEVAERDLPKGTPIVSTAHAVRKLRRQGFSRLHTLDLWQSIEFSRGSASVRVTALPAKHAPQPLQALMPPVIGSMLDVRGNGATCRLYVTGDTLMHDQLREIPSRFPGIDLALVHLGGTRILGVLLTMDGEQGAEALEIIDPDAAIPIHHGDYTVFKSPISDFDAAIARRKLRTTIHHLERGDAFDFELSDATS